MIDSDTFFHQISLADGFMRNQNLIENIYKTIDIYDLLLSYEIEFNKTYVNTILSKLLDLFKNCDNQIRFMINNLILKYHTKFTEIFIKRDIVNTIIQVLTCNDSTSRFYAIQLTKYLPFLLEQRVDLIYTLIDLLINKSSPIEKKEIIALIQRKEKKFNFNKIFIKEIVENFEEIYDGFENDNVLKLNFLNLIENSTKVFNLSQCMKLYQSITNLINFKFKTQLNLILTLSTLILYKISNLHNFIHRFLDEILFKILLRSEYFPVFLSSLYFLCIKKNPLNQFINQNREIIYNESMELIKKMGMSKYSFLGLYAFIIHEAIDNKEEYENLLAKVKENIPYKIESKYLIKLIHESDLKDNNKIFKILDSISISKNHLTSLSEIYRLNDKINATFDKDTFLLYLKRLVDFTNTNCSLLLVFIKTLKKEFITNNDNIEKIIIEKDDPLLLLHYYYLGDNINYNKIISLYSKTSDIIQKYKLLKVSLSYKDFNHLSGFLDDFIIILTNNIDKPLVDFYKSYFQLMNKSLMSITKATNYFTKKINLNVFQEENTSTFFKYKLLKYSQNYATDINDFSQEFISCPAEIVRALYTIMSIAISSKVDIKALINSIDLLLNSASIFLLNKERIIKNLIAMKLFFLKYGVDEAIISEITRITIFNEINSLISKIVKYYIVFHELISFKFEIKTDYQKEIVEKNKENFSVFILLSLKGLGYYNINYIQIHINVINDNDKSIKSKFHDVVLKENENYSISKAYSLKINKIEKNKLKIKIEIFFIYKESLKFKFVSVVKSLFY